MHENKPKKGRALSWLDAVFGRTSMAVAVVFIIGFFVFLGISYDDNAKTNLEKYGVNAPVADTVSAPSSNDIQIEPVTDLDWVKGNRNAKISIIEFSDTECPFCKKLHMTMQRVIDEYGDQVNWVYRHFPISSSHPKAPRESEAVECAGELAGNDGFWAYLDRLFEITPSNNGLEDSQLPEIARYVGLNVDDFNECLNSGKYAKKVQDHVRQAVAAGGEGTPYSVIITPGGQKVSLYGAVPFEQFRSMLEPLLQ